MEDTKKKIFSPPFVLVLFFILSVVTLCTTPFFGTVKMSLWDVLLGRMDHVDANIFYRMRVSRVLIGFFAGAAFAVSGMVFQALFRNPLVAPSTLGVSAGASLGATIYIWLHLSFYVLGVPGISLLAFLGALLSITLVWALSRVRFGSSIAKMLLAGVALSFLFVSMIMFLQYLSDISQSFRMTRWLMGGLFVFGYDTLFSMLPFVILGCIIIFYFSNELNLLMTGEETAISRGVDAQRVIKILFYVVSVIIGSVVSICGPITFVDIIVPHICRMLIGNDHRYLIPATFMGGGILLTICDAFGRTIIAPAEIPVGIITALLGAPFFLWILRTRFDE